MSDAREVLTEARLRRLAEDGARVTSWQDAGLLAEVGDDLAALSDHVREHGSLQLGEDCVVVGREPSDAMVEAARPEFVRAFTTGEVDPLRFALRAALLSLHQEE